MLETQRGVQREMQEERAEEEGIRLKEYIPGLDFAGILDFVWGQKREII